MNAEKASTPPTMLEARESSPPPLEPLGFSALLLELEAVSETATTAVANQGRMRMDSPPKRESISESAGRASRKLLSAGRGGNIRAFSRRSRNGEPCDVERRVHPRPLRRAPEDLQLPE